MTGRYILKGRETVLEPDLNKWGRQLENNRKVGFDIVGDKRVSTVFLCRLAGTRSLRYQHPLFGDTEDGTFTVNMEQSK